MAEQKKLALVGGVFFIALAILILGVLWFKNVSLGGRNTRAKVEFPSASGLMKGDPVEARGVASGQIADIEYQEGHAIVTLDLDRSVTLFPTATFSIENIGIMGQKKVTVDPGWGTEPVNTDTMVFKGHFQPGIPEFMGQMVNVMTSVERLAQRLDTILATIEPKDDSALSRIITNTDVATRELAAFLQTSGGDLRASAQNLRGAMEDVHQTLDGREDDIGAIIDNSVRATSRLDSALVSFQQTSDRLNEILGSEDAARGTLAQIARDPALYQEMVATLKETRELVTDIKANPGRYVSLSLF